MVMMMVVVVIWIIIAMVVVVVMVMVMVMVAMMGIIIILSHHHRLIVSGGFGRAALVLGAQNVPGVRNRVQQFRERARLLQRGALLRGSGCGRRNTAKERQRRGAAEEADERLVQGMSFPA